MRSQTGLINSYELTSKNFFLQLLFYIYFQKMKLSINIRESLMMKRLKLFFKISIIKTHQGTNEAHNNFILTFCTIYDTLLQFF